VLLNESDRGAILVCAEILNGLLEERLTAHMIDDPEARQGMLGRDAPFGTLSSRIAASYAFGLIDKPLRKRLDQIRRIRNQCAHHVLDVTFLDQRIRDIVLTMPSATLNDPIRDALGTDERSTLRLSFVLNCSDLATILWTNIELAKQAGPPPEGHWFIAGHAKEEQHLGVGDNKDAG
jgi:hypothetical protein